MLAAEDDWTPLARTEAFVKMSEANSRPITMKIFPDAFGYFDDPERDAKFYLADAYNPRSQTGKGATFGYNATAAADALKQVQDFLGKYLQ